jgi:8-oxo-dGTP pyrophosphatase MutT (NUDIX family)
VDPVDPVDPVGEDPFASEWRLGEDGLWFRRGARVLLLREAPRAPGGVELLLVRGHDADQPERSWWFTVGGGIGEDEAPDAAAVRELAEETGIAVDRADLVGPVFERSAVFDFLARTCRQDELLYLARLPAGAGEDLSTAGWTDVEGDVLDELRWWALPDLAAAEAAGAEVYPAGLSALVSGLVAGWDGVLRRIG